MRKANKKQEQKEPKNYTNEELENAYIETKDINARVLLNTERINRAKTALLKIKTGYDLEKFVNQYEWSAVFAENNFQLVNEDFNIHCSKDILTFFNKKILLDFILLKTTSASGHNGLIENTNENNLLILNNFIRKITSKEELTLSLQELQTFIKQPMFITDKDKNTMKGVNKKNEQTNNNNPTNTETGTGTDRKDTDRPNGMANGKFGRYRTNECTDSNRTRDTLDDHLRKPPGADVIEDDSEFDENGGE